MGLIKSLLLQKSVWISSNSRFIRMVWRKRGGHRKNRSLRPFFKAILERIVQTRPYTIFKNCLITLSLTNNTPVLRTTVKNKQHLCDVVVWFAWNTMVTRDSCKSRFHYHLRGQNFATWSIKSLHVCIIDIQSVTGIYCRCCCFCRHRPKPYSNLQLFLNKNEVFCRWGDKKKFNFLIIFSLSLSLFLSSWPGRRDKLTRLMLKE